MKAIPVEGKAATCSFLVFYEKYCRMEQIFPIVLFKIEFPRSCFLV